MNTVWNEWSHALQHGIVRLAIDLEAGMNRGGGSRRVGHVHDHLRLLVLEARLSAHLTGSTCGLGTYPHFS